jgi:hypothetical protein
MNNSISTFNKNRHNYCFKECSKEPFTSSEYIYNKKSKIIFKSQLKELSFNQQPSYEGFYLFSYGFNLQNCCSKKNRS